MFTEVVGFFVFAVSTALGRQRGYGCKGNLQSNHVGFVGVYSSADLLEDICISHVPLPLFPDSSRISSS